MVEREWPGGEQRVAYVRTKIHSDKDTDARLLIGSDDGAKIWLNGAQVFALNTARALTALGAPAECGADRRWRVQGVGVAGLQSPAQPLDFGNSGTGVRLAMGLMASTPLTATCAAPAPPP